jgi:hypothetical protein
MHALVASTQELSWVIMSLNELGQIFLFYHPFKNKKIERRARTEG